MTKLTVSSSLFEEGGMIPSSAVHSYAGGGNRSPDLSWKDAPPGTASFALTCYDPDAPTEVGFVHWILFNIPREITSLPEGAGTAGGNPSGSILGYTDWGNNEYGGCAPPPGDPPHHYLFTVYALDVPKLELGSSTTYAFLRFSLRGHILAEGTRTGLFGA